MNKINLIAILIPIFIVSTGCISAAEVDNDESHLDISQIDSIDYEISNPVSESEISNPVSEIVTPVGESEIVNPVSDKPGTYYDLNQTINGNDYDVVNLTKDYKFIRGSWQDPKGDWNLYNGIIINRPLKVNGNGHSIDGDKICRMFYVNHTDVSFHNITFKNGYTFEDGGAITTK